MAEDRSVALSDSRVKTWLAHGLLILGLAVSIFPFYWMIVMATNTTGDIYKYPPKLVFGSHLGENVQHVLQKIDFFGSMLNTLYVSCWVTLLVLFFDSLAAFVFAKFEFPGKKPLFLVVIGTFMIPAQLSIVPMFVIMAHLGWVGSFKALIIPAAVNAFGIFFMRQFAITAIHDELLDAARIDGCGFLRMWWHVAVPVLRPGLAFLGIFTFIGVWNDYMWPLIVLVNPGHITLQVALSQLNSLYNTDYSMVMAGTLMAVIPLIIVFIAGARQFLADLAAGAVKS